MNNEQSQRLFFCMCEAHCNTLLPCVECNVSESSHMRRNSQVLVMCCGCGMVRLHRVFIRWIREEAAGDSVELSRCSILSLDQVENEMELC